MPIVATILVGLHTLLAWVIIEIFFNIFHGLKRRTFIVLHYLGVIVSFGLVFWGYYAWFVSGASAFEVMAWVGIWTLIIELVVFRYLYSGDRWFFNYVDWIIPFFLILSTVYWVGMFV